MLLIFKLHWCVIKVKLWNIFIIVDGVCYGLDAGNRNIDLYIDACDGYATSNGYSGWNAARTMLIMEVTPQKPRTGELYVRLVQ